MKSFFKSYISKFLFLLLLTNTRMQPAVIVVPFTIVTGSLVTMAAAGTFIIHEVMKQYRANPGKNSFLISFPGEKIPIQIDIAAGSSGEKVVADVTQGAVQALSMKLNLSETDQKELYGQLYSEREKFVNTIIGNESANQTEHRYNVAHDAVIRPMKIANREEAQAALNHRIKIFKQKNARLSYDKEFREKTHEKFRSIVDGFIKCNSENLSEMIDARVHLSQISQCDPDIFGWKVEEATLNLQARYFDKDKLIDISYDPRVAETMKIFLQESPYNWKRVTQYEELLDRIKELDEGSENSRFERMSLSLKHMFLRDRGQQSEKEQKESYKEEKPITILGKGMFLPHPDRRKEIFNNPYNKALHDVAVLCEQKRFEEAEALAKRFGKDKVMGKVLAHYKVRQKTQNFLVGLNTAVKKVRAKRIKAEQEKQQVTLKAEADSTQKEKQKSLAPAANSPTSEQPISTPAPPLPPQQDDPDKDKQDREQVKKECPVPPLGENKFLKDKSQEGHKWANRRGHVEKTPENEKLIYDVANDPNCYYGPDGHGNHCYAKITKDGRQAWAEVRDNQIRNCGINEPGNIRTYNSNTGFKALRAQKGQKIKPPSEI